MQLSIEHLPIILASNICLAFHIQLAEGITEQQYTLQNQIMPQYQRLDSLHCCDESQFLSFI